jgi:hypothetical protein
MELRLFKDTGRTSLERKAELCRPPGEESEMQAAILGSACRGVFPSIAGGTPLRG